MSLQRRRIESRETRTQGGSEAGGRRLGCVAAITSHHLERSRVPQPGEWGLQPLSALYRHEVGSPAFVVIRRSYREVAWSAACSSACMVGNRACSRTRL